MVAHHPVPVHSVPRPYGKLTDKVALAETGLDDGSRTLGDKQGIQRSYAAEDVPESHGGIIPFGSRMDFAVRPDEPAVGVGDEIRMDAGMIPGRV